MFLIPNKNTSTVGLNGRRNVGQTVKFDQEVMINSILIAMDNQPFTDSLSPRIWDRYGNQIYKDSSQVSISSASGGILRMPLNNNIILDAGVEYMLGFETIFGATSRDFQMTAANVKTSLGGRGITPLGSMKTSSDALTVPTSPLGTHALCIGVFVLSNGKLKDQSPGTVINFADSLWTILDPTTGYLVKQEDIGSVPFGSIPFNPSSGIGNYLNNDFYNTLPSDAKAHVKNIYWNAGWTINEAGERVLAKVGLLSYSEWGRYSKSIAGKIEGILDNPAKTTWLLTPSGSSVSIISELGKYGSSPIGYARSVLPSLYIDENLDLKDGSVVFNKNPFLTVSTLNNSTLYENDILLIDGTAKDTDKNDIVNVWYQINSGSPRAIQTRISDGVTDIPFSEQLIFKGGQLLLPDGTALTGALTEGITHKLKVWAEDNKGGKSTVEERTFYVVPNRPPKLTINPFSTASDLIDTDKVTITGTTSDPDGNDTVVSYKLNNGLSTEIYRGPDSDWSFDLQLSSLKLGENTAVVDTIDAYNSKTSLTRKLKKTANLTPLAKSVQRYTLIPPAGTAQGLLLWLERHPEQAVTVEISMTNGTEQEQYVAMTLDSSGPSDMAGRVEDFFKYRADVPAEKIAIKLSWTGDKPIYRITGALTQ